MSWRPNQQSKPWPWPNAVHLEDYRDEEPPAFRNSEQKSDNPEGQILGGTVYKNAFPIPGDHFIYKSKKKFKDKYAKNKAKFERKARLPPITEAISEASSKAGSTRSTHSFMIPRYNPDILSDVMASDDSSSEDEESTRQTSERRYRKSHSKTNGQPPSLHQVDVIRNVQPKPHSNQHTKSRTTKSEVWPSDKARQHHPTEKGKNFHGLHRTQTNGDVLLANHLTMNNGTLYKERHPLGISQIEDDQPRREFWTESLSRQQSITSENGSGRLTPLSTQKHQKRKKAYLVIGLIISIAIVLLGAGIAAYFLVQNSSEDEKGILQAPPNVTTVKYIFLLHLQNETFSTLLENKLDPAFTALADDICGFLYVVPIGNYLYIFNCEILTFWEGSIIAETEVTVRQDDITVLKAQKGGLTTAQITLLIVNDINTQVINASSQTAKNFVEKYNVSAMVQEAQTIQPTRASETSVFSSTSTSSFTATATEALSTIASSPVMTEQITSNTGEVSSTEVPLQSSTSSSSANFDLYPSTSQWSADEAMTTSEEHSGQMSVSSTMM